MSGTLSGIALVVICAAIEGCAQVCLKKAALAAIGKRVWVMAGVAIFALEAALYTVALHLLDVSVAYPLGALSFISVIVFSRWLLREQVDTRRWAGVGLILIGCALVAAQA